jgi:pyruvate/2-oxoglutarate dehydrogenase complex dihydrolipoamide dehydrogenase (E3) component
MPMSVDYDLVILGGSRVARFAAIAASQLKARVALVEPDTAIGLEAIDLFHHSLLQATRMVKQLRGIDRYGLAQQGSSQKFETENPEIQLEYLRQRAIAIAQAQSEASSPVILAARGVDVIFGQGEFHRRPQLGLTVNGRDLRSRTYLLAPSSRPIIPQIEGLGSATKPGVVTLTAESLAQSGLLKTLPEQIIVVGDAPRSIELAQVFAQLGSQVTLIVSRDRLLPREDAEAAGLIQAQLESEGIRILTQTTVTQVKRLDGKTWVQAGHQVLEADQVLLSMGQQPHLETLNLEAAGVKHQPWGIPVNPKLQTTNPRIYACGDVLGGYSLAHIAQYEAEIALKNALFYPNAQVNYYKIPWTVFTQPELARVGLTEHQAQQQFGQEIQVLRQFSKMLSNAQLQGELTGFCKLIVRRNGKILGAHLVGPTASEMIAAIALAMQQNLSVQALAQIGAIAPSWSELLQQTAAQWQDRSSFQQELLEGWFNLRRSWSR